MKTYCIENSLTYLQTNDNSYGSALQAITDGINLRAAEAGWSDDEARLYDELARELDDYDARHEGDEDDGEYAAIMLSCANLRVAEVEVEVEEFDA